MSSNNREVRRAKAIQKKYARTGEPPKGRDKVQLNRINGQAQKRFVRSDGSEE